MTPTLIAAALLTLALVSAALGALLERAASRARGSLPRNAREAPSPSWQPGEPKLWDPREWLRLEWPFEPRSRDDA